MSTNTQRIIVFLSAVIVYIIGNLVQRIDFDSGLWFVALGVEALIIFELMHRTQNWVRLITLPLYGVIYLVIQAFVDTFVGGYLYDYSASDYIWKFDTYIIYFTGLGYLISAVVVLLVVYFLTTGKITSLSLDGEPIASDDKTAQRTQDVSPTVAVYLGWLLIIGGIIASIISYSNATQDAQRLAFATGFGIGTYRIYWLPVLIGFILLANTKRKNKQ